MAILLQGLTAASLSFSSLHIFFVKLSDLASILYPVPCPSMDTLQLTSILSSRPTLSAHPQASSTTHPISPPSQNYNHTPNLDQDAHPDPIHQPRPLVYLTSFHLGHFQRSSPTMAYERLRLREMGEHGD